MSSRVLTVMFTDIQGFTERTSSTSRESLRELLAVHEDLLLPVAAQHGGRLVKTIGDALLVAFTSPTNAVLCGLQMQSVLASWNQERPESDRISIRVALSAGEVEERDNDVFGEAVNVAARLEAITEAGEVWFTDVVYLAMNKAEVPSSEVGIRRFKGIPEPVKVYRAISDPHAADPSALTDALTSTVGFNGITLPPMDQIPPARTQRSRAPWAVLVGVVVVVAGIAAGVVLWEGRPRPDSPGESGLEALPQGREEPAPEPQLGPAATSVSPPAPAPAPAPTPPRDPIKAEVERLEAAIQRSMDAGNLEEGLANAVALVERHPELETGRLAVRAMVGEQVRNFIATKSYDKALSHLDRLEGRWVWLNVDEHRTDIRLAQVGTLFAAMNHAAAYELLSELLDKDPQNLRVAREMIERFGAAYTHGARVEAVGAAFTVARNTEGRLEALVGDTILDRYFSAGPYGSEADLTRELLIARYPPAIDAALARTADRSESTRVNAYRLLHQAAQISDEQALAHHFQNLTTLSSVSKGTLEATMEWIGARAGAPGWEDLKKRAALPADLPYRIFGDFGERPEQVTGLLARAFMPEITDAMVAVATTSQDYRRRCNAYAVLRDAEALQALDRDTYHAWILLNFPPKSIHRCYDESVAWFAAATGDRVPAARAALVAGRAVVVEALAAYKEAAAPGWNSEAWPARAERNIEALDAAVKSLPSP
ncbi:MAG: adenylate/guanylate cyclase domain-containing protein [Pseudomonadota bacterium]